MNRISEYIQHIISIGICLQKHQTVEIVCSSHIKNFIEALKEACLGFGASRVYIRYTDGVVLERRIQEGYSLYIEEDIIHYQTLIQDGFCRIVVQSPFSIPLAVDERKKIEYRQCMQKLEFIQRYFEEGYSQRTICLAANPFWASRLHISERELWERIIHLSLKESRLERVKDELSALGIKRLRFKNALGTDFSVSLTENFRFQGKYHRTKSGILFQPNIPCLEIYTAPVKNDVNGRLVSSKALYYRGHTVERFSVRFEAGRVISAFGLEKLLQLDQGLAYAGEIALCETIDAPSYHAALLDENTGCHLALGRAYPFGIEELEKINSRCSYHVDLVFGSGDLLVLAETKEGDILLMENGKWVYEA